MPQRWLEERETAAAAMTTAHARGKRERGGAPRVGATGLGFGAVGEIRTIHSASNDSTRAEEPPQWGHLDGQINPRVRSDGSRWVATGINA